MYGDAGNDFLWAGDGDDFLDGEISIDILFGATGNNELRGGDGFDTCISDIDDVLIKECKA